VLSPLLAHRALHGMEAEVKATMGKDLIEWYKATGNRGSRDSLRSLTCVRYADDFIFAHNSKEMIEKLTLVVANWLSGMGLTLKESKTRITHSLAPGGVHFLGCNIRQFRCSVQHARKGRKTLIKPSREAEKSHQESIKDTLQHAPNTKAMISRLVPKIVGWRHYYRTVVSRKSFEKMDHLMYWKVFAKLRRDGNAKTATKHKADAVHALLPKHADQKITRHIKVKGMRSPFDGDWAYWATRLGKSPDLTPRQAKPLKSQKGRCGHCHQCCSTEDLLEVHHVDGNHKNDRQANLQLLHRHCHQDITRTMRHDKAKHVEEPCAAKVASTVLKPSGRGDPFA